MSIYNTNEEIKKFKKRKGDEFKAEQADKKKKKNSSFSNKDEEDNAGDDNKGQGKPKKKLCAMSGRGEDFHTSVKMEMEDGSFVQKPDWKKVKADRKELKLKRKEKGKENKDVVDVGVKIKKLWEELRQESCTAARKKELCSQLWNLIGGKVKLLIFAHDTVRVVETLLVAGGEEYSSKVFEEVKSSIVELCKNKYAHFFLLKMLRCGTRQQKDAIMSAFEGKVVDLMKHKIASDVVELAYNDYARAPQRSRMLQEFFGPEFKHFKDESIKTLADALEKHSSKQVQITKYMREHIQGIVDKGVFTNSFVHTLLKEYLSHCAAVDRPSLIEGLREGLLPIVHTKDGARTAMLCLWHGTAKDRKVILKSFKGHYIKMCTEDSGSLVLMAALDCVDDTKFLKKAVLEELMAGVDLLAVSESGRKLLKYMVAPRNRMYFHPDVISVLEEGDNNPTSRKDAATRRAEVLQASAPAILTYVKENLAKLIVDPRWTLFIGSLLTEAQGPEADLTVDAVAEYCAIPFLPDESDHFLEASHSAKLVTFLAKKNTHFQKALLKIAGEELPGWTLSNRGCFILLALIECSEDGEVAGEIKKLLEPRKKRLSKSEFTGAALLVAKL